MKACTDPTTVLLIAAKRHEQIRTEQTGWVALLIALGMFKHELQMPGDSTFADVLLIAIALGTVLVCLVTSIRLGIQISHQIEGLIQRQKVEAVISTRQLPQRQRSEGEQNP